MHRLPPFRMKTHECVTPVAPVLLLATLLLITLLSSVASAIPPARPADGDRGASGAGEGPHELLPDLDLMPGLGGGPAERTLPLTGTAHVPVLLVQFAGQQAQIDTTTISNMMFSLGTYVAPGSATVTGSVSDYFRECGGVSVWGDVLEWVTLPRPEGFYVNGGGGMRLTYPMNSQGLVRDAIALVDAGLDFRQFDNDGPDNMPDSGDDDGYVDCLIVVFNGFAAESYTPASPRSEIWSHCYWLSGGWGPGPISADGVLIDMYTIQSELRGTSGSQVRDIGVFCHEMGHAMGLPDLWSTCPAAFQGTFGSWNGLGEYCLMANGCWGSNWSTPDRPHHLSGFAKGVLGWANINYLDVDLIGATINEVETSRDVYANFPFYATAGMDLNLNHPWNLWAPPVEGWIVENRQQTGFDTNLPGSGLLIYHMDGFVSQGDYDSNGWPNLLDNAIQWAERRPLVRLECPDQTGADHSLNNDDLAAQNNQGDAFDFFYQGNPFGDVFDLFSNPSSVYYNGNPSAFAVRNVSASGATMTADLLVGSPAGPNHDVWLRDCDGDDGSVPSWNHCSPGWTVYTSPDIWVDNNLDGVADAPVPNCTNLLHVKVRNAGPQAIDYAKLWIYDLSQGMAAPPLYPPPAVNPYWGSALICSTQVQALAPNDSCIATVWWYLPSQPGPFQFPPSVAVIVETADDTLSTGGGEADDNNIAMVSGAALYCKAGSQPRHASDAAKHAALSGRGELPSPGRMQPDARDEEPAQPVIVHIPINNPFEYDRPLTLDVETDLPAGWSLEIFSLEHGPVVPPWNVFLPALTTTELELIVTPDPEAVQGDAGSVALTLYLTEMYPDPFGVIGGYHLPVEVDVIEPMTPTGLTAVVVTGEPCIPGGGGVLLSWDPVEADVSGITESPACYVVYRGTEPDFAHDPSAPLATYALDAVAETARWECFDPDWAPDVHGAHPYYRVIAVDAAGNESAASEVVTFEIEHDYAEHETDSMRLTVTDQGILGCMEPGGRGSGLQFPPGDASLLYVGSFWASQGSLYVAGRDFEAAHPKDWVRTEQPGGLVRWTAPDWMPELPDWRKHVSVRFHDAGSGAPRGWEVEQCSVDFGESPNDDFVLIYYKLTNVSGTFQGGVTCGLYLDLDVDTAWENQAGSDPDRQLAYVHPDGGGRHAGVMLLSGEMENLCVVDNRTYIFPEQHLPDAEQYRFLTGSDEAHSMPASTHADDWSVLASTGPFDLEPDESVYLTFAVLVGDDLDDMMLNADAARAVYLPVTTAVPNEDAAAAPIRFALRQNSPNPFNPSTTIRYELPERQRVAVDVFDVNGRLIERLLDETQVAGEHALEWKATTQPSGVYLLRVRAGGETRQAKMILLK